jgi:hypothetical protein
MKSAFDKERMKQLFSIEDNQGIIDHVTDAVIDSIRIENRLIVIGFNDNSSLIIQAFDYKLSAHIAAD